MRTVCETKARKPKCASKTKENITISAIAHDIIMQLSIWESTILTATQSTFMVWQNQRKLWIQTMYVQRIYICNKIKENAANLQGNICRLMSIFHYNRRENVTTLIARDKKMMLMLRVISLSIGDYIYTPRLDSSTFLPGTFSPSSNINQQALFPETRDSLSKRKPSNTCTSKRPARTWVKNQAFRLRQSNSGMEEKCL